MPDLSGTRSLRIINNQPAASSRTTLGIRGSGCGIAQPRPCCRHTSCERCKETWNPGWQLAHSGTGPGPPFDLRPYGNPRQARLRDGCRPPRVRIAAGRIGCCLSRRPTAAPRTLVFADLIGKGGQIRTVPIPDWVAEAVAIWLREAGVTEGAIFRAINKAGRIAPDGFSPKVI